MLNKIHYNHLGMEKCKSRAREILYWPLMNKQIEDIVASCTTCMQFKTNNLKQPLMLRDIPNRSWEMVGLDLFYFKDSNYLLAIDYYSKYVDVAKLNIIDATNVTTHLKSIFARYGSPEFVFSDNGPQFNNSAMRQFAKNWNFTYETSILASIQWYGRETHKNNDQKNRGQYRRSFHCATRVQEYTH